MGFTGYLFIRNSNVFNPTLSKEVAKYQVPAKVSTDFSLETPQIKDKNVARFYLWTIEDPLLTAPGFNTGKYQNAIMMLKNENDLYVRQYNMPGNIFPLDFLNDLIEVNNAHNEFIKNPTSKTANDLLQSYKLAVKDYKQDALSLKKSSEDIIPQNIKNNLDKVYLIGVNTVSSIKTYLDDLDKIIANADALSKEVSKRENCLEKGVGCERPVDSFSKFSLEKSETTFTSQDLVPKDLVWINFATMSAITTKTGPYEVNTGCFGLTNDLKPKDILFDLFKVKKTYPLLSNPINFTQFYAQFANDRIYHFEDTYMYEGSNPQRVFIIPSNDYMCPSAQYKAKLNSINYLYSNFKDKQIFSDLLKLRGIPGNVEEFLLVGQNLEKKFFNAQFPSQADADNLVNYYGLLYRQILIWRHEKGQSNDNWLTVMFNKRMDILNLYLEYKRGLTGIDELISNLMYNLYSFRLQNDYFHERGNNSNIYVYTERSGYGLVYFPFSASFYRLNEQPEYNLKVQYNNVGKGEKYIDFKQLISEYSLEQINSWTQLFSPKYLDYLNKNALLSK